MMTPIETQPTINYSAAASMPGSSSADGASEVIVSNIDVGKTQLGGQASSQQVSFAETHIYMPTNWQEAQVGTHLQLQSQPPPYAAVVQQQQPMASASVIYPWNHQVPLSQGFAVAGTTTETAVAAAANGAPAVWMPLPRAMTLCPPGLEYLAELSQLNFVEQMVMTPITTETLRLGIVPVQFSVRNAQGQQIYVTETLMVEMTTHMVVAFVDCTGQVRMTVKVKRGACPVCYNKCCGSCALDGIVEAPPGTVIGTMEQRSSGGILTFVIKNAEGSPVLSLEAPNPCSGCPTVHSLVQVQYNKQFTILSMDGRNIVGSYEAQQTLPTSYSVKVLTNITAVFPPDLDIKVKATLAGAGIMLNCYFFGVVIRSSKSHRRHHHHHHR